MSGFGWLFQEEEETSKSLFIARFTLLLNGGNVRIITPDILREVLGGKYGRVKRA